LHTRLRSFVLLAVRSVIASADNLNVYAVSEDDNGITVFSRNSTGHIKWIQQIVDDTTNKLRQGLAESCSVAA
jgi:hypothetical protein